MTASQDSLPATHRAAVVVKQGHEPHFEVRNLPLPQPGPNDVLVRLTASGVCGTDFALASGELGPVRPILGHEGIGRVVKLGSSLSEAQVRLGQRVGVAWLRDVCGECAMCMHEVGETRCYATVQSGRKVDGTFAEYTLVPLRYLMRLPEKLADEQVAPILCGGLTIYKALKICGATPGGFVAISGAGGGVGALGIQYAKAMGFHVVAVDAGDSKRAYCSSLGAEVYVDVTKVSDAAAAVKEATGGRGASAVLVTAGTGAAYQASLGMLAPFGTMVCIGIPPPSEMMNFHPLSFIDHGYRVIGSAVGTRGDVLEALEFVDRNQVTPMVQTARLEDLTEMAKKSASGQVTGKYVIKM
ncbi:alcohol dehydrogenase [Diplodia corticola]|uniref:alcohol dehydrogenase n=1 Tax=Diplodia corticola TaxID=236234 RepID=A0A1J9R3H3_9PEZI|nr:alcohol dehydrogenase [Diplodia corticola]OJD35129.1 alcohol dehydrogenase [Diplodia corticola]